MQAVEPPVRLDDMRRYLCGLTSVAVAVASVALTSVALASTTLAPVAFASTAIASQ